MTYTLKNLLEELLEVQYEGFHLHIIFNHNGKKSLLDIYYERSKFEVYLDKVKVKKMKTFENVVEMFGNVNDIVVSSSDIDPFQENKISVPLNLLSKKFPKDASLISEYQRTLTNLAKLKKNRKELASVLRLFRAFVYISRPDLDKTFESIISVFSQKVIHKIFQDDEYEKERFLMRSRFLKSYMFLHYFYLYLVTKHDIFNYRHNFFSSIVKYAANMKQTEVEIKEYCRSHIKHNLQHFKAVFSDYEDIVSPDLTTVNTSVIANFLKTEWPFHKKRIEAVLGIKLGNNNDKKETLELLVSEYNKVDEMETHSFKKLMNSKLSRDIAQLRERFLE